MKRIAYLVSQYPAASHTFIRREIMALRSLGHLVDTFSVRRPTGVSKLSSIDQTETTATWYALPPKPVRLARSHAGALLGRPLRYASTLKRALGHRAPGLKGLLWSTFHFAESIDLAAELQRRQITHLHNHFANAGANVGYLAAHYLRLSWSLTLHGTSEFDYPAGLLLADKIRAARFVACVTHFGRAQAMRLVAPEHWNKFHVVRAGIDPPKVQRRATTGDDSSPARLICVGRLSPEKGHAGLLEAFARLKADGINATLDLLGEGPERPRIEAQLAELGLEASVHLHGQVSEEQALAAMASGTVVVLASFMEGLPVVIMEALALGVPVVAPCVAGIPELVEHGVSGLTFPPGDWDSLTEALRRMLSDPELRKRSADNGRRRVEQDFFVERSIAPLVAALQSAAAVEAVP
jgi:glycosyltransferase involved in cell wall biosynthesis